MKRVLTKLFVVMTALLTIAVGTTSAEEIKVSAGGTTLEGVIKPIVAPFEKASGDKITVVVGGANISFKVLDRGDSNVSIIASTLVDMFASLKKEGYEVKDKSIYQEEIIGKGLIVVAVNKENPVKSLTKAQIKAIYTGKLQNWKELGGNDEPILVIISSQNPATSGVFKKLALDGEEFVKDNLDFPTFGEVREGVAANPGAIGFGSMATLSGEGTRIPQMPEFVRTLSAFTKGAPSAKVRRLINFIKGEGQKFVKI
jgi:phosphate transport system substrate-binding protein